MSSKKEPLRPTNFQVPNTPKSISHLAWGTQSDLLACTSWNGDVCVYNVQFQGQPHMPVNIQPVAHYTHASAPALSCCINAQNQVWSSGADGEIRMFQPGGTSGNESRLIGKHALGVKCLLFSDEMNVAISGGWDKQIKYWDVRQQNPNVMTVDLPEKVYSMAHSSNLMAVGLADRKVAFFDLTKPQTPMEVVETTLKYQFRCMSMFLKGSNCVAVGSIEGRAAIQYLQDHQEKKRSFAFKCHRQGANATDIYGVNAISVHPVYNTFSTAGGDGCFTYWDKDAKQKLQQFHRAHPALPIVSTGFNKDGRMFAYACAYDWSQGAETATDDACMFLHFPGDEIKPFQK